MAVICHVQILQAANEPEIAELLDVVTDSQSVEHFRLAQPRGRDKSVDEAQWTEVKNAFTNMAFSAESQQNIYKVWQELLYQYVNFVNFHAEMVILMCPCSQMSWSI